MNGKKILKNKKYKRILEISEDSLMVTTLDSRFYRRNGKYYPSITHVLSAFAANTLELNPYFINQSS